MLHFDCHTITADNAVILVATAATSNPNRTNRDALRNLIHHLNSLGTNVTWGTMGVLSPTSVNFLAKD